MSRRAALLARQLQGDSKTSSSFSKQKHFSSFAPSTSSAHRAPRPSPRLRRASVTEPAQRVTQTSNSHRDGGARVSSQPALPPVSFFGEARKGGLLSVEPRDAIDILRKFQEDLKPGEGQKANKDYEDYCSKSGTDPSVLTELSMVLSASRQKDLKDLCGTLLVTACLAGDEKANLHIFRMGLYGEFKRGTFWGRVKRRVESMCDRDRTAMTLKGLLLEEGGESRLALEMYRRATSSVSIGSEITPDDSVAIRAALINQSLILWDAEKRADALTVCKRAAIKHDDPTAYWLLAQMESIEGRSRANHEMYLLKAASAGLRYASDSLKFFYGALETVSSGHSDEKTRDRYAQLAEEWTQLIKSVDLVDGSLRDGLDKMLSSRLSRFVPESRD